MGHVHHIILLMMWFRLSNDNTCLWLGNITIFDQRASQVEAYLWHYIVYVFTHVLCFRLISSMNNKHLSWNKEMNNNFIIASRTYFLHYPTCTRVNNLDCTVMILTMTSTCFIALKCLKEIGPRGNNKVVIYISLYHDKFLLFMLELY